ncbi:Cyclic di-GMP phosphodiesterase response regulator RpfG [Sporomusa ovata DSM 2662]|uniref:HD-GYP domain n=2 Tax=Sporomusa ovata TaxID=2378 RepID=A0A0U1L6M6_9FIRM|nr:HD domain-containing phosphohydrolase [Sporomusa ovata]EQB28596.1 diguanylate cyclase [Sporomusa ovata DSM 2662]CQR74929.1 HD-GYP domain [Sporomusa ovata]
MLSVPYNDEITDIANSINLMLAELTDACHHEKYDGTDYPQGLAGTNIPILARIINVIDSFDVMTHKRIYKEASTYDYAISELIRCSGSQFDPMIVTEFLKLLEEQSNPF